MIYFGWLVQVQLHEKVEKVGSSPGSQVTYLAIELWHRLQSFHSHLGWHRHLWSCDGRILPRGDTETSGYTTYDLEWDLLRLQCVKTRNTVYMYTHMYIYIYIYIFTLKIFASACICNILKYHILECPQNTTPATATCTLPIPRGTSSTWMAKQGQNVCPSVLPRWLASELSSPVADAPSSKPDLKPSANPWLKLT